jgi:heme exporter protein A
VSFEGRGLREAGPGWREHLAYVAHANALKDDLSAAAALAFLAGLRGRPVTADGGGRGAARLGVQRQARLPVRALSQGSAGAWRWHAWRCPMRRACGCWTSPSTRWTRRRHRHPGRLLLREHAARGARRCCTSHQALPPGLATRTLDLDGLREAAR